MEISQLHVETIDFILKNFNREVQELEDSISLTFSKDDVEYVESIKSQQFALKHQIKKLESLEREVKTAKTLKKEKNKIETIEQLLSSKGDKTIDWSEVPDSLDKWRDCIYDYEKGVTTHLSAMLEQFSEEYADSIPEGEEDLTWDDDKKQYNFPELEKAMNKLYPGIVKFLIDNKVKNIRFYW